MTEGQDLMDNEGYVYKLIKTLPPKDKKYWNCMFWQRFGCPVEARS
jgi:hypothetical protein